MTRTDGGRSVILLNRFYWPDEAATAQMLTDLAEDLAERGWGVTVIASRGSYSGGRPGLLSRREKRKGVEIRRVGATRFSRIKLAGRTLDYIGYLGGAMTAMLRLPRADAVVTMSDPPMLIGLAIVVARLRNMRAVYWVQDLFPQLAGELGVLKKTGTVYRVLDRIARWMHQQADLVIALGPRMASAVIEAGARADRTHFVHNWADAKAIVPVEARDNSFISSEGLHGRFVVLYSGNAGRAHVFEDVCAAMRALRNEEEFVFVFVGGGARMADLRRFAESERLDNVRFLGYIPRAGLAHSLSAASVSLVTEDPAVAGLLVPSKTYGILASGRPILFVGSPESDVAEIVQSAGCGFVVPPGDPAGLVERLRMLRDHPALVKALGTNARRAAEHVYDRRIATAAWAKLVAERVCGQSAPQNSCR